MELMGGGLGDDEDETVKKDKKEAKPDKSKKKPAKKAKDAAVEDSREETRVRNLHLEDHES
jgi:hypothetical protein